MLVLGTVWVLPPAAGLLAAWLWQRRRWQNTASRVPAQLLHALPQMPPIAASSPPR